MKKVVLVGSALVLILSACLLPGVSTSTALPESSPAVMPDLELTVASSVQQTLESIPTSTLIPSPTVEISTATSAAQKATATSQSTPTVQNPALLTLTSTLSTGTPRAATSTATPALRPAVSETAHFQYYGTMPPLLAYSKITLVNKSKSEVYISLQCTTKDGYQTIIEYPVEGRVETNAPTGKYIYVAWVGGRQMTGKFALDNNSDIVITIFKDHLEIK